MNPFRESAEKECVCAQLFPNPGRPPFRCDAHGAFACNWCGRIVTWGQVSSFDGGPCQHTDKDGPHRQQLAKEVPAR